MTEMWRLFIAIEIPPAVLEELAKIQEQLKQDIPSGTVKWVRPESIHLSLKFLGDVPVVKRNSLESALAQAAQPHSPFTLEATGLGCFPNLKRPRVIWVGIQHQLPELAALREAVEEHIAPLGYPTENRPFNPHLTVGRIKRNARRDAIQQTGALIANTAFHARHAWEVNAVHLIRSELKPTGAEYTPLYQAPFNP